jgi:hypothetical protein
MRRVLIESPYAGTSWFPPLRWYQRIQNVRYARKCMRDCLALGEAPYASHLLLTQPGILRDWVPSERRRGIDTGLLWGNYAEATVVYLDRGCSSGMIFGIKAAQAVGRYIEFRSLKPQQPGSEFFNTAERVIKIKNQEARE